jgi:hypothetical protein
MVRLSRFFLIILIALFPGCSANRVDVSINSITVDIQDVFFRGIQPDIEYSMLRTILGEPMEFLDIPGDYDEREHSPIYYFSEGKIICHWGGDEDELIGMVEYIPYNSYPLYLTSLFSGQLSDYSVMPSTKAVRVFCNDVLYYRLLVENSRITSIEYWMAKRSFLNVAY